MDLPRRFVTAIAQLVYAQCYKSTHLFKIDLSLFFKKKYSRFDILHIKNKRYFSMIQQIAYTRVVAVLRKCEIMFHLLMCNVKIIFALFPRVHHRYIER